MRFLRAYFRLRRLIRVYQEARKDGILDKAEQGRIQSELWALFKFAAGLDVDVQK